MSQGACICHDWTGEVCCACARKGGQKTSFECQTTQQTKCVNNVGDLCGRRTCIQGHLSAAGVKRGSEQPQAVCQMLQAHTAVIIKVSYAERSNVRGVKILLQLALLLSSDVAMAQMVSALWTVNVQCLQHSCVCPCLSAFHQVEPTFTSQIQSVLDFA